MQRQAIKKTRQAVPEADLEEHPEDIPCEEVEMLVIPANNDEVADHQVQKAMPHPDVLLWPVLLHGAVSALLDTWHPGSQASAPDASLTYMGMCLLPARCPFQSAYYAALFFPCIAHTTGFLFASQDIDSFGYSCERGGGYGCDKDLFLPTHTHGCHAAVGSRESHSGCSGLPGSCVCPAPGYCGLPVC